MADTDTRPQATRNTAAERLATRNKYTSPKENTSTASSSSREKSTNVNTLPQATRNTAAKRLATRTGSAINTVDIVDSKVGNEYTSPKEDTSTASSSSREKSTDEGMGPSVSMTSPKEDTSTASSSSREKSTDEGMGPSVSMTLMKINKGDTLSAIAKRHGTTVKDLMDANPYIKDANKIYAGKSLTLKKKPEVSQDGYKKGGSLRRSGGGGLGVGQALRGWGAVRKK